MPKSVEFTNLEQAVALSYLKGKAVVIKPKSTNYGLGITIFQQAVKNREDFAKAVEIAFREDKEVMVEDYLVGTEYRFFVLGVICLLLFWGNCLTCFTLLFFGGALTLTSFIKLVEGGLK